jgi:integrase
MVLTPYTVAPVLPLESPLFKRFLEGYLQGERRFGQDTVRTYVGGLRRLEDFLVVPLTVGPEWLPDLGSIRSFVSVAPYAQSTKRTSVSAYKAWVRFLVLEGELHPDRMAELEAIVVPDDGYEPPLPLQPAQVKELLAAIETPAETKVVYLGLFQGTRISETARMDTEHRVSDEDGDRLRFQGKGRGRRGKVREIPLHPEVGQRWDLITSFQTDAGDVRRHLEHVVEKLRERVGFFFVSHTLRDTFAQTLLNQRVLPVVVSDLLGHAPRDMLFRHYGRVPFDQKKEAINQLRY